MRRPRWRLASEGLLTSSPAFRRYWTGRVVSYTGSRATVIALTLQVASGSDGARAVGLLLLAQEAPRLLGPLAGAVADRARPRRLLIGCDLGQAALVLTMALWLPALPVLLLLVMAASGLATLFAVTGRALLPQLVDRGRLLEANGWLGTAFNLQGAVGPLLAAGLIAGGGVRAALLVDVASFLVSALLLRGLPSVPSAGTDAGTRYWASVRDGLGYVIAHRLTRLTVGLVAGGVLFGSLESLALVFLTRDTLRGGAAAYPLVFTAFALGTVAASLALTRRAAYVGPLFVFLGGQALTAVALLAAGAAPSLLAATAAMAAFGVGNGAANIGEDTVLQTAVPARMLGRVGGVIQLTIAAATAITYLAGPTLLDHSSPRLAFLAAGAGTLLLVVLLAPGLRSSWTAVRRRAGDGQPEPAG